MKGSASSKQVGDVAHPACGSASMPRTIEPAGAPPEVVPAASRVKDRGDLAIAIPAAPQPSTATRTMTK
ncbi:MAG: hypothetical protein ACK4S4_04225 [Pyrinomonadaceae bacterium]